MMIDEYPMLFEVTNQKHKKTSHCGRARRAVLTQRIVCVAHRYDVGVTRPSWIGRRAGTLVHHEQTDKLS
jgi:hypothetical protein